MMCSKTPASALIKLPYDDVEDLVVMAWSQKNIDWVNKQLNNHDALVEALKFMLSNCGMCGGQGYTVGQTIGCCRQPMEDGGCCGNGVPEPVQEPCECNHVQQLLTKIKEQSDEA